MSDGLVIGDDGIVAGGVTLFLLVFVIGIIVGDPNRHH